MFKLFILFLIFLLTDCKTGESKSYKNVKDKRFLIPVFQYSKYDREKNLDLTQSFAKEWKNVSDFDYFIKDKKIAEDILRSGSLLPSTNFSINCEFHEPGSKIVMLCALKDLETGEVISSDSHQNKDIEKLKLGFNSLAKNLFSDK